MKTINTLELCLCQKIITRLFLVNLKEPYSSFLKEHADIKPGFPNSANCNHSGVFYWEHLVPTLYVFAHQQNLRPILDRLNLEYKDFLKFLACDPGNKHFMIHRCPNCTDNEEQLYLYLKEIIESLNISDEEIRFCQWTTTDRANLINFVENFETCIENVIEKVQSITIHS